MLDKIKAKIAEIKLPKDATGLSLFYNGRDGQDEWCICPNYRWGTDGQCELLQLTPEEGKALRNSKYVGKNTYGGLYNRELYDVKI